MDPIRKCSQCGKPVPASHLAAGYARMGAAGATCAACLTPHHGQGITTILPRSHDPRRMAWNLTAMMLGGGALFCFYQPGMQNTGLGMLLLVATALVAFTKVLEGAVR